MSAATERPVGSGDVRGRELSSVREELRRRGYLTHGVERRLLQDALRPRRLVIAIASLTLWIGLLAGGAAAAVAAGALAVWNLPLRTAPLDLLVLWLHLLPLAAVLLGGLFLLLVGVTASLIRLYPALPLDVACLVVAVAGAAGTLVVAVWAVRELAAPTGWWLAGATVLAGVAALVVARLLHHGLVAVVVRLTERVPGRRLFRRRWVAVAVVTAGTLLVLIPAILSADRGDAEAPAVMPMRGEQAVLLVGVDGVLAPEVDHLLWKGRIEELQSLWRDGGTLLRYRRPEMPPASFWTTIATGLPAAAHGIEAVDGFRPLGMETELAVSGPLHRYWEALAVPLGLAVHRPALSAGRRAPTVWELAARGGEPVSVVNWWTTFPVQPIAGTVVAHGAWQLLDENVDGLVWPAALRSDLLATRRAVVGSDGVDALGPSVGAEHADRLWRRAIAPDAFYRRLFVETLQPWRRLAALYLPALDLAAVDWDGGTVGFADLVERELAALGTTLAAAREAQDWQLIVLVFDPGRRGGAEGRVLLWRPSRCQASSPKATEPVEPAAVTAAVARALGLPQSAELPSPPTACDWEAPPARVDSYGRRQTEAGPAAGGEYLESLRSLGYL